MHAQVVSVKIRNDRNSNSSVRDRTVIRVAAESLRSLAAKLPNEFPFPDEIPETHNGRAGDNEDAYGDRPHANKRIRGRGGGRAGGRGGGRGSIRRGTSASRGGRGVHRGAAGAHSSESASDESDKSSNEEEAVQREENDAESAHGAQDGGQGVRLARVADGARRKPRFRRVYMSSPSPSLCSSPPRMLESDSSSLSTPSPHGSDDSSEAGDDNQEEPAPIPEGFRVDVESWVGSPWQPAQMKIDAFMWWSSLDGREHPQWYCMKVVKVLNDRRWTYEVHVLGSPRELRGIKVTEVNFKEGVFLPLLIVSSTASKASSSQSPEKNQLRGSTSKQAAPETSDENCRQKRSRLAQRVPFHCEICNEADTFLYCPPHSIDGEAPRLMCMRCKPSSWVCVSRADYMRAVSE